MRARRRALIAAIAWAPDALLEIDRGDVWRWLRDDTRSLADLARPRGRQPESLAAALVAPWRGKLRDPERLARCRSARCAR